jgi:hypothetical protein
VPLEENGTPGQPYQPGDIVSFTGNSKEPDGHVAIVTASTENANGNGKVTIIEENAAPSGKETLTVSHWKMLPAAGSYVTPSNFDALAATWGKAIQVPGIAALNTGGDAVVISVSCPSSGNCSAGGVYTNSQGQEAAFVVSEVNAPGAQRRRSAAPLRLGGLLRYRARRPGTAAPAATPAASRRSWSAR